MTERFDAIVIGSGFGGAVLACRLAERGMTVLVLERGRRWTAEQYPRKPDDPWVFDSGRPAHRNGWLDLRFFRRMTVAQSAGVGGGSLVYSNVAVEVPPSVFARGWPSELTYDELKPYYARVAAMMGLQTLPDGQLTARFTLARDAAATLGYADRLSRAPLAVSFSPDWRYELPDPFDRRHSVPFTNAHGQQQGTCIHLGNCGIGCDVRAKNTLDLNYLPRAEKRGAEIRPLHVVRFIEAADRGYRVMFDRVRGTDLVRGHASAPRVFLSAGSLGSTELLLQCRDERRTLSGISRRLGHNWSPNANLLSLATYTEPGRVQQTIGPPISALIDFMDGTADGQQFIVEDDGFPSVLMNALRACLADAGPRAGRQRPVLEQIAAQVGGSERARNLMVWLGCGVDAADGQLRLRYSWRHPSRRALDLSWDPERSAPVIEAIAAMHRRFIEATGGRLAPNPAWRLFRSLVTLQPLGGCPMGDTPETGVVDHLGQVFGYPNLYVADGSILPSAVGRNPSHTIAALAERTAAHVS